LSGPSQLGDNIRRAVAVTSGPRSTRDLLVAREPRSGAKLAWFPRLAGASRQVAGVPRGRVASVNFQDQKLICKDCGQEFIWSADEQGFYASKGLLNAPTRCPADRAARLAQRDANGHRPLGANGKSGSGDPKSERRG
jgi:hypothetical protein